MANLPFLKMHGAGNDFVIIDVRTTPHDVTDEQVRWIADRHKGVGFDQLVFIEPSHNADCFMRIYNPDASRSATCGNATRCVADLLLKESGNTQVTIETLAGILNAHASGSLITVNMGKPKLDWQDIPLREECDTLHLNIGIGDLHDPVGVSMGNPHAVFFVDNMHAIQLETLGPLLEHHELFPERANINVAHVIDRTSITLRVWERGAGETLACGSGACATLVAAKRRNLIHGNSALITLKGGQLHITQEASGHVMMTGDAIHSFSGVLHLK